MAYIGKSAEESVFDNRTVDTMTGNGSDTTLALSTTPISVNNVLITFNGVMQRPTTDYTLSGSTITFTTAPFNGAIVYAITGGGEHIGTPLQQLEGYQFADNAVTDDKIVTGISASKLTGTKGAWNASALTGLDIDILQGTSDPTVSTTTTAGEIYLNKASGELYVCTDATANANVWTNVGAGTGDVVPNVLPSNPSTSNTDSFPASHTESSSYTFTFSGATDSDGSVTHYLVDTISNAALTVTSAEVAAGQAHTFNTGAVGSDVSGITFRVRAKDNEGAYSSGVTITTAITNYIYTVASSTNSTNTNGVPSGDYIYHTFNQSGTFTVTTAGTDNMDFLVIAGGAGGGGSYSNYWGAGGGGGGAYRSSVTSNGGGSGLDSKLTPQTYEIEVGGGGPGGPGGSSGQTGNGTNGDDSYIEPISGGSTIVVTGGGGGGSTVSSGGNASDTRCNHGVSGGSGGAGAGIVGNGASSSSYGNNGGNGGNISSPRTVQGGGGGGSGAYTHGGSGGNGGSGIVIVRYKYQN